LGVGARHDRTGDARRAGIRIDNKNMWYHMHPEHPTARFVVPV
jgi:hypothetical protein